MENCLVTKLKSVVDNDNLVKIGEYKMHISLASDVANSKIAGTDGTVTILGNNNYYFTQNGQQVKTISYSNTFFTWPAGEYDVLFTNKYGITICEGVRGFDLDVLSFSKGLTYIGSQNNARGDLSFLKDKHLTTGLAINTSGAGTNKGITGSLSSIAPAVKNINVSLISTSITGDIALLGNTGNKQISVVYCPYITGSIEGLVEALVSDPTNPFTSGTKNVHIAYSGVTINGSVQSIANASIKLVMEDPTHWYYPSNNNDYIDNPNYQVTIYAKNPTAEQISAWKANNNVVVTLS